MRWQSSPRASLIVDGKAAAVTPLGAPLRLGPGAHGVLLKRPGFRSFEAQVEILAERVVALEVEMPRTAGVLVVTAKAAAAPARVYVDGTPRGEPATVSVVSQLTDPARVVMAEARDSQRLHVGFTAVDARGATAVGHLLSNGPSNPRPLIENRGYGILDLDALGLPHGALFVVDSPLGAADTSPRELVVRQVSGQEFGAPLTIQSPDHTARAGRLARLSDGTVLVAYTGLREIYVERLRCPEIAAPASAAGAAPVAP